MKTILKFINKAYPWIIVCLLINTLIEILILIYFFSTDNDLNYYKKTMPSITPTEIATPTLAPSPTTKPTATPTPRLTKSDMNTLKKNVIEIISTESENYGVYIKDLESGLSFEINGDIEFPPASIYKVPLAIITLVDVDSGKYSLETEFLVTEEQMPYTFDRLAQRKVPYNISINEHLKYLIIYSDNAAMTTLEDRNGGVTEIQDRLVNELGINNITRKPHITTLIAVGGFFEGLYNNQYLSKESNQLLIDLLKNVTSGHNNRIVAGVPEGIDVAHKIGNLNKTHEDAGIVYEEKNDFIIVVLNKDITSKEDAAEKIKKITELTYQTLEK